MKAKKADNPRVVKSWRLQQKTVNAIARLANKKNKPESVFIEETIDKLDKKIV